MDSDLTIRDYIKILQRRWPIILATMVTGIGVALAWSLQQTPLYESSATLLINQNTSAGIFDPVEIGSFGYAERLVENEARFVLSEQVAAEAEARLGYRGSPDVDTDNRADVITVSAWSADPFVARDIAQTYAEAYIDVRQDQLVADRLDAAETLLTRIEELDQQIPEATELDRQRLQLRRAELIDSFDRLQLTAELATSASAQVIHNADVPSDPGKPLTGFNAAIGGLAGLLFGIAAAYVLEHLDSTITTVEEIEDATPGVPMLSIIPVLDGPAQAVTNPESQSAGGEAFRRLRAALQFVEIDREKQVIQITSAGSMAGKTTVAANLAAAFAHAGHRVIVVDADLRRPRLHQELRAPQAPGLTSVVLGTDLSEGAHEVYIGRSELRVVPSGPLPPGPSELLGSERAAAVFQELRRDAEVIIVDSPPVLAVADALVLAQYVDVSVVVANARRTKRESLRQTVEQLQQAGARVAGTVLNEVRSRTAAGGYTYGYYPADRRRPRPRWTRAAQQPERASGDTPRNGKTVASAPISASSEKV